MNKQELEKWIAEHETGGDLVQGIGGGLILAEDLRELLKTHAIVLREPNGKLVKSISRGIAEHILYWGNEEINKMSEVIDCEEGSARFASCGGINGVFSRMRRAFKDEDYRKHLVKPPVTEGE